MRTKIIIHTQDITPRCVFEGYVFEGYVFEGVN